MSIISVVSGKGGVGKTTIVSGLGTALVQRHGKNTLAVDCNITTAHLGMHLGFGQPAVNFNHVLRDGEDIHKAVYTHSSGLKVLPASLRSADLDGLDLSAIPEAIRGRHREFFAKHDLVLLDCAPGLGREAMAGLRAAEGVLFVTTPHPPAITDVIRSVHAAKEFGVPQLGLVVNMAKGHFYEVHEAEISRMTGLPVLASIPYDESVLKGLAVGMPVTLFDRHGPASYAIHDLAKQLVEGKV